MKKKFCPKDSYIFAIRGQFEAQHDGDNSALNGVGFRCKSTTTGETTEFTLPGLWGEWNDYVEMNN